MNVGIHQPDYIPWLGLFYKMYLSDVFIHLDDAQYSNEAAHNFNEIKTSQGAFRIKFPVEQHLGDTILQVRPRYELRWRENHLKTFEMNYARGKYFKDVYPAFREVFMGDYPNVAELNISINEFIAGQFGIAPRFVRSSEFGLTTRREEKVIDLCLRVGGTRYISGNGARAYQVDSHFTDRGITLSYLDYQPVPYTQLWGGFLPCMSVLDYVFNCGYDWEYVVEKVKELNERNR